MFIVLLGFSSSLARVACPNKMSVNDEPCIVRPNLINLNSVELKYYPFKISLDKCNGSSNDLSPKMCVPKKARHKC